MTRRFEITSAARADLAALRYYLKLNAGARTAERVLARLRDRLAFVRRQPLAGSPQPELGDAIRIVVSQRWVIYYEATPELCRVLRVLDGAQDRSAPLLEPS